MLNNLLTLVRTVNPTTRINHFHSAACLLAGHSKWQNIRHIKATKDAEKSQMFARYSHRMRLVIQEFGSANPQSNAALKSIIEEALRKKMPQTTIQNVLKKYAEPNAIKLTKFFWDMKVLNKVYMVIVLCTENVSKTKNESFAILKKYNGIESSARHLFDEQGIIDVIVPDSHKSLDRAAMEEKCTDDAIECGAEEVEVSDFENKGVTFLCEAIEIPRVRTQLEKLGYVIESSEHIFIPKTMVGLSEAELEKLQQLVKRIKAIEGIQEIFDNVDYGTE